MRKLNTLTEHDLVAFIRSTSTSQAHHVSQEQFELSLRSGSMLLILDGLDELNHEIRDKIGQQIIDLERDYPKSAVIVSGRPDPRFGSWTSFHVYKACPLNKQQTLKLISGLEYDKGVKRRFSQAVSKELFDTHRSFLSSPLLTSIMLLTFEEFAEIPQRMHEFYGQAFDTLLQKHDAQKDQYQRKTHTNLTREDFRGCFSAFCAFSYLEEKFSFKDDELRAYADNAIKYVRQTQTGFPAKVTGTAFLKDLGESVCMLQQDGLETAFVHRSFQEYFAALFVTSLHGGRVGKFLDRCAARWSDSVIPMATDMSRETIEKEWVADLVERLILETFVDSKPTHEVINEVVGPFDIYRSADRVGVAAPHAKERSATSIEALAKIYPKHLAETRIVDSIHWVSAKEISSRLLSPEYESLARYDDWRRVLGPRSTGQDEKAPFPKFRVEPDVSDQWWLDALGFDEAILDVRAGLVNIRKELRAREKRRTNILDEFIT